MARLVAGARDEVCSCRASFFERGCAFARACLIFSLLRCFRLIRIVACATRQHCYVRQRHANTIATSRRSPYLSLYAYVLLVCSTCALQRRSESSAAPICKECGHHFDVCNHISQRRLKVSGVRFSGDAHLPNPGRPLKNTSDKRASLWALRFLSVVCDLV